MTALHHRSVPVSSPDVIGPLVVRTADTPEGRRQAAAHLEEEHFLGAGRTAGDALWQLVYEEGAQGEALVAVIVWCAAAFRLKDRDAWIGWDSVTRARRLKLIVQARRFLVLECARRPNLASKSLGAARESEPDPLCSLHWAAASVTAWLKSESDKFLRGAACR